MRLNIILVTLLIIHLKHKISVEHYLIGQKYQLLTKAYFKLIFFSRNLSLNPKATIYFMTKYTHISLGGVLVKTTNKFQNCRCKYVYIDNHSLFIQI